MGIRESKTQMSLVIEKTLKKELLEKAQQENRSLNNMIEKILSDYIKKA